MLTVLKNAKVLMYEDTVFKVCEDMFVIVENDIIKEIGEMMNFISSISLYKNEINNEIDCKGNLIIPGMKNAHTHSAMTFLRSQADDLPLSNWLNEVIFPAEAKLTPDDIYHLTKLAVMEYVEGGITAAFDMYLTPDTIAQSFIDCGFRCTMTGGVNNFSQSVSKVIEWDQKWNQANSLIKFVPGFHAEYTCSKELLEELAEYSQSEKRPVFAHISETKAEVDGCMERYHLTPPAFLEKLGLFDYGGGGYHCVHFTDYDYEIFKSHNLYAITNPASNLKLASGIAGINNFLQKEIPVAIGTDGPASNNCLDFFREMFLVTGLAKAIDYNPVSVPGDDVLKMACVNGAYAMQIPECDSIAVGKKADLVLIDLSKPNMHPLGNYVKNLVYSCNKSNVILTMVNGQILYQNGEFYLGEDVDAIYQNVERITERILRNN